ncbi:MAG: nickel pincer cofactor biosynthesis protein LarC [Clostridiales bacterium]|jgi:uncharacterized protein (TIGR00299 family) protein|nr:nickel pincer cofactor biosynthesis protein LarC [Clostridiales bacterium]
MRTLYFDCGMGAAGDMLAGALLPLTDKPEEILKKLNEAGLPGVVFSSEPCVRNGIGGVRFTVKVNGEEERAESDGDSGPRHNRPHHDHPCGEDHPHDGHPHGEDHPHHGHPRGEDHPHDARSHTEHSHDARGLSDILSIIGRLNLPAPVKQNAAAVYTVIAEAESSVHGAPVGEVHFHEVGALDAMADITACCLLIDALKPGRILASPVATGYGQVRCAHGLLPVPAPATALILRGIPAYAGETQGELCTPTGAALLKHFAGEFMQMPVMAVSKIGYGMGGKTFERVNCVRAFLGECKETAASVAELVCNLDDMTPEASAFAQQLLMEEGALDVTVTPTVMKKGRAGVIFSCMCAEDDAERFAALLFKHTTTIGLRVNKARRFTLTRATRAAETRYGAVRVKEASGFGSKKAKPEYEDLSRIAKENGISLAEAAESIQGQ